MKRKRGSKSWRNVLFAEMKVHQQHGIVWHKIVVNWDGLQKILGGSVRRAGKKLVTKAWERRT